MSDKTFEDLKLIKAVLKAVKAEQYHTPTPIQLEAIPHVLNGRDVLGIAQTGTGKTAAFALPILHYFGKNRKPNSPKVARVLVLSPTRELAAQTAERFAIYGQNMNLKMCTMYGGVGQKGQVKALTRGIHILIATPGRLIDLIKQEHVDLSRLNIFVLDEADRMLDMGFLPDLNRIVAELPEKRQSLFFSATMPPSAIELADTLLHKPVRIDVTPYNAAGVSTVDTVEQRVMFIEHARRKSLLTHLLKHRKTKRVLVFVRTKHSARKLSKMLIARDFATDALHGDRTQQAREKTLKAFRRGMVKILIATDVAARGLDVDGISHVINYDMPSEPETYVHRIGRTARAGAVGNAITFCVDYDLKMLNDIEHEIQQEIPCDSQHPYHIHTLEENRHKPEMFEPEPIAPEPIEPEAVSSEAVSSEAVTPEAVTSEAAPSEPKLVSSEADQSESDPTDGSQSEPDLSDAGLVDVPTADQIAPDSEPQETPESASNDPEDHHAS